MQTSFHTKWQKPLLLLLVGKLLFSLAVHAGDNYAITKAVVVGGGGTATAPGYVMHSSIGQQLVGPSQGGDYQLAVGFFRANRDLIFTHPFEI